MRAWAVLGVVLLCGCQCEPREPTPGGGRPISSGPGMQPGGGGGAGADGGVDGGVCPGCSADGLSVVDCAGNATRCASGLVCAVASCLSPCVAAVAEQSTLGCEFYAAAVPPQFETKGSCYAVIVANTRQRAVQLEVTRGTRTLDARDFARRAVRQGSGELTYEPLPTVGGKVSLPPGEMALLFLAHSTLGDFPGRVLCPVEPAVSDAYQFDDGARFDAFVVKTTAPVAAWDLYPYGGATSHVTSASLLLPTSAWSTSYVAMTPAPNAYLQIVAQEDRTVVQLKAPVAISSGPGLPGAAAGALASWTLAKGEVAQVLQSAELGGAFIRSSRPVAVFGGTPCMNKPLGTQACDSAHQQLPPVAQLSHEYVGVRYPTRGADEEEALWRVVGVVDGTTLTWTPPVAGAPRTLAAGQQVEFAARGPFVVTAQDDEHVFGISQLMTGGWDFGGLGDPDWVLLVPPGQFLAKHLFFVDPTYTQTQLVFVRRAVNGRFAPVSLDCGPTLSWHTVTPDTQYATLGWSLNLSSGCEAGVHSATSALPFGITVWGLDSWTSYAWPSAMGTRKLNSVDAGVD
ncbi:MAG: IgGFc-binding protein [Myxococcota bacterium]